VQSFSDSQALTGILWKSKIINKPATFSNTESDQSMNSSYFLKLQFNIILPLSKSLQCNLNSHSYDTLDISHYALQNMSNNVANFQNAWA
jgi:hypothetical protein